MVWHVYNKSIAKFTIFNNEQEYKRMIALFRYYQAKNCPLSFSDFMRSSKNEPAELRKNDRCADSQKLVEIIAYCVMPTHPHLILNADDSNSISAFMSKVLNSYTRYFNIRHKRKGPLWEGRSKAVLIKTDEQLIHDTRYVHLNPVTACLVEKPENWLYSSYREYLGHIAKDERLCNFRDVLDIKPIQYKNFVEEGISYQRELAELKKNREF